ncbi:hypothetical protein RS030_111837 [Cryptosporidium xiaoi]|uniref:Plasmodium RESA N-terminal domain-containing protein n=1 Tax=Cryptosporidium xiaoi TaxID=659607 RepID=A0AAV9Y205_9CRYT
MELKLSINGLISIIIFSLSSHFLMYDNSITIVEAAGAIPKILKRGNSYELKHDDSEETSIPKEMRCTHLGEKMAKQSKVTRGFKKFYQCLKDFDGRKYPTIHDKNMEVSKKCAKYGMRITEHVKEPTLDCIFCFKEIVNELIKNHESIKEILDNQSMLSVAYLYTLIIFEEKYIRSYTSKITEYVEKRMWFDAYSDSRQFCGVLAIIFYFWNRVVRDTIWPYIIYGSGNYYSRFPIEYGKFNKIMNQ